MEPSEFISITAEVDRIRKDAEKSDEVRNNELRLLPLCLQRLARLYPEGSEQYQTGHDYLHRFYERNMPGNQTPEAPPFMRWIIKSGNTLLDGAIDITDLEAI